MVLQIGSPSHFPCSPFKKIFMSRLVTDEKWMDYEHSKRSMSWINPEEASTSQLKKYLQSQAYALYLI